MGIRKKTRMKGVRGGREKKGGGQSAEASDDTVVASEAEKIGHEGRCGREWQTTAMGSLMGLHTGYLGTEKEAERVTTATMRRMTGSCSGERRRGGCHGVTQPKWVSWIKTVDY